ncbi:pickpocket protein 28-like isoform X2 [Nilaparvata lugens]|uniref:pickpocket protein 28-like isoform X2 n=1 Tax=Nilaparvata lugens TaxID=108931 RepID=UPI00193E0022|nr:pickpocket protein 28-like isoform X2 [Nilaparvata lugens]XP_039286869.1 pickpocket protein 28-like isoform X2 [Nilaparvata lugens]
MVCATWLNHIDLSMNVIGCRIFWLLALALVYTGMTITITAQVRNYLSNPVLMSLNGEITPTWDIPFPAITICSENQINPSLINFTELINKQNRTIEEKIKLNLGVRICTDYIQSFVNEHLLKMMHDLSKDELLDSEANMKITLKIGTTLCKRIIKSFSWQNIRRTNPCAYLQMFSTKAGICFTFNMLPTSQLFSQEYIEELAPAVYDELTNIPYKFYLSDRIWELESGYKEINFDENSIPWRTPGVSYDNSATFVLDFLSDDMDENCIQGGHGFWTAVHNPAEPPTPYQTVAYAETDATTIFKISPQLTSTSENLRFWTPEARGCYYSHERKLKFYSTYTLHNCDIECEAEMIYNECNCSVNVLSHRISTPLCGIHQVDCLKKVIIRFSSRQQDSKHFSACNCLPACTEIAYDMEFSSLPMLFEDPSSNISKNATKKGNTAVVSYLFKTNSVSNIQRVAIVTISDFIANIGGLMGLFLGFSFISLFEVIYFMTARWATDVWNNRRI